MKVVKRWERLKISSWLCSLAERVNERENSKKFNMNVGDENFGK